MIFFDTETCGFHGPICLIQWAEDDGPIHLHNPWFSTIGETMALIEKFVDNTVVGFNLTFDWFHICQMYTVLALLPDRNADLRDCVDMYAELEPQGRDGPCLKPRSAFDIMLHARKGPYQSTMDRGDVRIRRVPTGLAWQLAEELEKRIPLKDIYFARRKDKHAAHWQVADIEDEEGDINPHFKDVVLKFAPSSALKALAVDALQIDEVRLFKEIDVGMTPVEYGYAPFAKAVGSKGNWKGAWPEIIKFHWDHWQYSQTAREYATDDVDYTRRLYQFFGCPEPGDNDSILACLVGAVRWKGFMVDIPALKKLRDETIGKNRNKDGLKIPTHHTQVRHYVTEPMAPEELLIVDIKGSTKKILLQDIAKWKKDCPNGSCEQCQQTGKIEHPAAVRAQEVLDAREANYEVDFFDKLLLAGRFHTSFVVIGALSSRMAGGDGLNAHGVKKTKEIRSKFPLAFPGDTLCGGDFAAFEVTIAVAVYGDEGLKAQLLTCEKCEGKMVFSEEKKDFFCTVCGSKKGKKIHALFGVTVFPEYDYEGIKATEGTADDKYTKSKSAVFALIYGGTEHTLANRLGVPIEVGVEGLKKFHRQYPGVRRFQMDIQHNFCSMTQPGGIGTKVIWRDPADFRETMFGFRRYFTLENQIAKTLFELANKPPVNWLRETLRIQRRDRLQTASGAVQSALYGAAFGLQGSNMRAASNHDIQSAGATITKTTQCAAWELQPQGIHPWIVQPMQIHDELMVPCKPGFEKQLEEKIYSCVESFRSKVPLIKIEWVTGLKSWAEKG